MAAGDTSQHFVRTYEANSISMMQQRLSKFRSKITEKWPGPTEKHSFRFSKPRTAALTARANVGVVAGKRTATTFHDQEYGEKVASSTFKSEADSYSKPDLNRLLEDTGSVLYRELLPQVARQVDDDIIAALYAVANDTAGNNYAFGATGTDPTIGDGTGAFGLDMVLDMGKAFATDDVDGDETKFFCVSPDGVKKLLSEDKYSSVDYANARALQGGKLVEDWCGFTWFMSNRLTGEAAGTKYYPAFTRGGVGALWLQDVKFDSGVSPMNSFDTIVQVSVDMGAVRIQEELVKRVYVLEG